MNRRSTEKKGLKNPSYYYVLIAAVMICLFISFRSYTQAFYAAGFVIPCMLFLGVQQGYGRISENRKRFILSGIMVAWFLLLQAKRSAEHMELENVGLFVSVYLFAFPLASLLREGEEKRALKIFSVAYLTAASILAVEGLLLIFDCLPGFLEGRVGWDGGRIIVFWHPNVTGGLWMIGIILCTTFMSHGKLCWWKIVLTVPLILMIVMMALTSSRTVAILVGGYLGSLIFFEMVQRGRKWFVPAVFATLVVVVAFYAGERYLYQENCERLIGRYTQEYAEEIAPASSDLLKTETEPLSEEAAEPEIYAEAEIAAEEILREEIPAEGAYFEENDYAEVDNQTDDYETLADDEEQQERIPITVNPDTGEVQLITESTQGDIAQDLGTFNGRTHIWSAVKAAILDNPSILYWGIYNPSEYVSGYNLFPVGHLHNAWMECLAGMGLVGLLVAVLFTLMTAWNGLVILLKHHRDVWKRNTALLALCLLAASALEPYLFYTSVDYSLTNIIFFVCAGYMAYWQEEDNRCILRRIRNRMPFLKNK